MTVFRTISCTSVSYRPRGPTLTISSGPYGRWLRSIATRLGPNWERVLDLPAPIADAYLLARGIVPFEDSIELAEHAYMLLYKGVPLVTPGRDEEEG